MPQLRRSWHPRRAILGVVLIFVWAALRSLRNEKRKKWSWALRLLDLNKKPKRELTPEARSRLLIDLPSNRQVLRPPNTGFRGVQWRGGVFH